MIFVASKIHHSVATQSDEGGEKPPTEEISEEEKCPDCGGLGHIRACGCYPHTYKPEAWLVREDEGFIIWRCTNHIVTRDSSGNPVGEDVTCWSCMGTGKK